MTRPRTNGKSRESRRLAKERDYGSLKNMPPLRIKRNDDSFDLFDCELVNWMGYGRQGWWRRVYAADRLHPVLQKGLSLRGVLPLESLS